MPARNWFNNNNNLFRYNRQFVFVSTPFQSVYKKQLHYVDFWELFCFVFFLILSGILINLSLTRDGKLQVLFILLQYSDIFQKPQLFFQKSNFFIAWKSSIIFSLNYNYPFTLWIYLLYWIISYILIVTSQTMQIETAWSSVFIPHKWIYGFQQEGIGNRSKHSALGN